TSEILPNRHNDLEAWLSVRLRQLSTVNPSCALAKAAPSQTKKNRLTEKLSKSVSHCQRYGRWTNRRILSISTHNPLSVSRRSLPLYSNSSALFMADQA